jgi:hypothetical protein
MFNKPYKFALVGQPNVSITMSPSQQDLEAGMKSFLSGKSIKEAEQAVRKRIMKRLQDEGAEGARIVPVD